MSITSGFLVSLSSGSKATSCEACHRLARCHAPLHDNSVETVDVSCRCDDGVVGDGFTCYNKSTCSDDCCGRGYYWSPLQGCVDVDECSQPRPPCGPGQVCVNTPGSFTCLLPDQKSRTAVKSRPRSVKFGCGSAQCPPGHDCLQVNGTSQCVDPCQNYTPLQDTRRSTNLWADPESRVCDMHTDWQGWYRLFIGNSSVRMPERCIQRHMCGTDAPLWLRTPHPLKTEGIVWAEVCGSWEQDCCQFQSNPIHVKACPGNYYVYKLVSPNLCRLAYCADANTAVCSTCADGESCVSRDNINWRCEPDPRSSLRLVNGDTACSGRVEIFHNSQWGTVCDDSWDLNDAQVVCRQLGCGPAQSAPSAAHFGPGTGPIWMDDVACTGSESALSQCGHNGFGIHDCLHSEDAGVICSAAFSDVRLVNGDTACSGRVEIFHNSQWGTVCSDLWDLNDAQVVCRQLGCGPAQSAPILAHFGPGTGQIWMDDVACTGSESALSQCGHNGFGNQNCNHDEDAGVICSGRFLQPELACGRDSLRLMVQKSLLEEQGLNASSAHLIDPRCHQQEDHRETMWYLVERREGVCGNLVEYNSRHITYSNILFVYPFDGTNVSVSIPMSVPFTCVFPLDDTTSLGTAIRYQLPRNSLGVVRSGEPNRVVMTLYQRPDYSLPLPPGSVSLPLGSALHVGASVENYDNSTFVLLLENCYVTNSPGADDPDKYFLIQNRCPVDRRHVTVDESGRSRRALFSALLFQFHGTYEDVYLHCRISLCDGDSGPCRPSCSRRRARSAGASGHQLPVTIGPISWF
ncbi:uromodulin-like [Xyrichtys novacula]|uniref:Uromodulin-like n=1 Tax=Xyrichtys novacula TaxID=13765 RepID=A0AAV1GK86_XYRNO|nr:uromodulin-like [Xyrichtys novacula]